MFQTVDPKEQQKQAADTVIVDSPSDVAGLPLQFGTTLDCTAF